MADENSSRQECPNFRCKIFIWKWPILVQITLILREVYNKVGYDEMAQCYSFQCSEASSTGCLQRSDKTVLVRDSEWCDEIEEICYVTDQWDGVCIKKTETIQFPLYPGERCNATNLDWKGLDPTHDCAYGPKKCDPIKKQCLGWGVNQACVFSAECNPGLYCSDYNMCVPLVDKFGKCTKDVACGHTNFCYFKQPTDKSGQCVPWLGIKIGEQVSFKSLVGDRWSDYDAHLKCESYFVNDTGHCDVGFKVAKRGDQCKKSKECSTSLNTTHHCVCSMSATGTRVCDIGPQDTEWDKARTSFEIYQRGTPYCHTAHRQGECERRDLFYQWRCDESDAKYFRYFLFK